MPQTTHRITRIHVKVLVGTELCGVDIDGSHHYVRMPPVQHSASGGSRSRCCGSHLGGGEGREARARGALTGADRPGDFNQRDVPLMKVTLRTCMRQAGDHHLGDAGRSAACTWLSVNNENSLLWVSQPHHGWHKCYSAPFPLLLPRKGTHCVFAGDDLEHQLTAASGSSSFAAAATALRHAVN